MGIRRKSGGDGVRLVRDLRLEGGVVRKVK
jgi:hypothetical protein